MVLPIMQAFCQQASWEVIAVHPDVRHILTIKAEAITGRHSEGQRTARRRNMSVLCLSWAPRKAGELLQRAISPLRETITLTLTALKGKRSKFQIFCYAAELNESIHELSLCFFTGE